MSGVELTLEGADYVHDVFDKLITKSKNTQVLMTAIGAALVSSTEERIATEKQSPSGTPWQSLNAKYQQQKAKKSSGGILEREGLLLNSILSDADNDSVTWGSSQEYAAIHQFGGNFLAFGKYDALMPARPFLGISREDRNVIRELAEAYLDV